MHERDHRRWIAAAAGAAGLLAVAFTAGAEERSLTRAVYEFAVTGYCGLQDPAVEAGFRAEAAALTARGGLGAEDARRQRLQGWIAAEEEWRNRGLGGNRAWCAEEGTVAARHFRAIASGEAQP
ncbi:MAG: hypothetical protein ACM35H_14560 [Bacteroidota bacterium]|nr:hypothetical protein [Kiloniellaceae bacterium]